MDDREIIELHWTRSEHAVRETAQKYGAYCQAVAYGILRTPEDSEECVNDTWLQAWNAMPPQRPERLGAFLGRITRNLSLNRLKAMTAQKRGGEAAAAALEELRDCVPAPGDVEQTVEDRELSRALDRFLAGLRSETRKFFLQRYWYLRSVTEIAAQYGVSESKVKMSLLRTRKALKAFLEKEGLVL